MRHRCAPVVKRRPDDTSFLTGRSGVGFGHSAAQPAPYVARCPMGAAFPAVDQYSGIDDLRTAQGWFTICSGQTRLQ